MVISLAVLTKYPTTKQICSRPDQKHYRHSYKSVIMTLVYCIMRLASKYATKLAGRHDNSDRYLSDRHWFFIELCLPSDKRRHLAMLLKKNYIAIYLKYCFKSSCNLRIIFFNYV